MAFITFAPFGRGSTFSKSNMQTYYDTIKTLFNTTKLTGNNFSPDAGIPEGLFLWNLNDIPANKGHMHQDGSLADGCITEDSLRFVGTGVTQFSQTIQPGVVMIAGSSPRIVVPNGTNISLDGEIDFFSSSNRGGGFVPGTQPLVLISLYDGGGNIDVTANSEPYYARIFVESISDIGFTWRLKSPNGLVNGSEASVYIHYVAIGLTPGYIINPKGV